MSRYSFELEGKVVAYGYDDMIIPPGYFLQLFEGNDERAIVNEGFTAGIGKGRMFELFEEYNLLEYIPEYHKQLIALDLPI